MDQNTTNSAPEAHTAPQAESAAPKAATSNQIAILCYLGILVVIPMLTESKNDPFVKFHIRQGIVLLILWVICGVIGWVPIIGWLLVLASVVLTIMGILNVLGNKEKELPLIGKFAHNFKI